MPEQALDIDRRVRLSIAVGRYVRSANRFNEVSREFTEACDSLRKQLGHGQRFVTQADFKHYLVSSDRAGNLNVETIESL
ncbi:hypothetical protein [Crateriforma conspicua]|uniref:hypothetical protein n=1 Tax=Crateriforma conspicua TaxID=2527996 RepID=UPI00118B4200|nr:hypothetical protein [Crateriforma conspicua]QDV62497.1 hypothetical protein Mal65_16310 [Crateriforma conspicua]